MKLKTLFFLLLLSYFTLGQDTIKANKKSKLVASLGVCFLNLSSLNNKLTSVGYEKINNGFMTYSLGLIIPKNKYYWGLETTLLTSSLYLGNNQRSKAFNLQFFTGFDAINFRQININLELSLGLQTSLINFKKENYINNIDSILTNTANNIQLNNFTPVLGPSIRFNFKKLYPKKVNSGLDFYSRLISQIRIGYRYGLFNGTWKSYGNTIDNSFRDRLSSFYIQILSRQF